MPLLQALGDCSRLSWLQLADKRYRDTHKREGGMYSMEMQKRHILERDSQVALLPFSVHCCMQPAGCSQWQLLLPHTSSSMLDLKGTRVTPAVKRLTSCFFCCTYVRPARPILGLGSVNRALA